MAIHLNLEFETTTNEFGCTTYLDWKTPKYELLSYRKLKPHESQVRPQQSFCNRDILFNFFPTRQHTHKSYSETYSNPTLCSNIFLREHSHLFMIVFLKDWPNWLNWLTISERNLAKTEKLSFKIST